MQNFRNQLETPAVPDLPNPQDRYERLTVAQTNANLRTFFLKIQGILRALLGTAGVQHLDAPNGLFFSTVDQTLAATNTKYDITFNETYLNNSVSIVDSTKITCAVGGVYNFQFSAQAKSSSSSAKQIYLMINRDGTDIGYTTRQNTLPMLLGSHTVRS